MEAPTIPIQVDSPKAIGSFRRTRCVYYRLEGTPEAVLPMEFGNARIAAWGEWAVLTGPDSGEHRSETFDSPELIDHTLSGKDGDERLFLDLGHLWIPNELLGIRDGKEGVRQGDVFRMSSSLFHQCYRYAAEMIPEEEWLSYCRDHAGEIERSPVETKAFREWRRQQIEKASERYHSPDYEHRQLSSKKRGGES